MGLGGYAIVAADNLDAHGSRGSAVLCSSCLLTCTSCSFRGNSASDGAAVYSGAGRVDFIDAVLEENFVTGDGGALYASSVILDPKVVIIDEGRSEINCTRCLLRGNRAYQSGGAMSIR